MTWAKERATWPNAEFSRFELCKPHKWHVQDIGAGPLLLLVHGAGGSTHSWRHLIPHLIPQFRVVAVDLPGQGFSQLGAQRRCGLDAMAEDLRALCHAQDWLPQAIIGHSAGAAIALRMAEDWVPTPQIIGINAALAPFAGLAGVTFPIIAKTIAAMPLISDFFSATTATDASVGRILHGTGSDLKPEDIALYRRLVASRSHVNATLNMMAQWNLDGLLARLPDNDAQTLLITGDRDKAVPPDTSVKAAQKMPAAQVIRLPGLGHLAHEEAADQVAKPLLAALSAG